MPGASTNPTSVVALAGSLGAPTRCLESNKIVLFGIIFVIADE